MTGKKKERYLDCGSKVALKERRIKCSPLLSHEDDCGIKFKLFCKRRGGNFSFYFRRKELLN